MASRVRVIARWMGPPMALGLAATALLACAELPPIAVGSCGNALVEPELGEVCDTFAAGEGTACRAAGVVGACQFDCSVSASGAAPVCPDGWGCGADGICRAPSGQFVPGPDLEVAASTLATDDFDGDGRADLVATTYDRFDVLFMDADRTLAKVVEESASQIFGTAPAHADFDGDGRADLAILGGAGGIRIELGREDQTFAPTVQSSITTPGTNARFIAVDALEPPGDEVLVTVDAAKPGKTIVVAIRTQAGSAGPSPVLFTLDGAADGLAGDALAAELFQRNDAQGSPMRGCEEVVLAFKGQGLVYVLEPCNGAGDVLVSDALPGTITLPAGGMVGERLFVADVNGDGVRDVIIPDPTAYEAGCIGIDVAYGVGDGTFHDDPMSLPLQGGNDRASCLAAELQLPDTGVGFIGATPLAVADVDGDGRADFVDGSGVFLTSTVKGNPMGPAYRLSATADDAGWSNAVILDATGDGRPDVLTSKAQGGGATFLLNAGNGLFNAFGLSVSGSVRSIATGDFDGDLLMDAVLVKQDDDETFGALDVLFGRPFGAPEAPQGLGSLEGITQLVPGDNLFRALLADLGDTLTTLDATTDLAVVFSGSGGSGAVALLPGSTDRRLASPVFLVQTNDKDVLAAAPFLSVAGPFADGEAGDFATLAWSPGGEVRLWTLPSTGGGLLGDAVVTEPLPPLYDWYATVVGAADLDDDARMELVGLTYRIDDGKAVLLVASADPTGLFTAYVEVPLEVQGGYGDLLLVDVDGDGDRDAVALVHAFFTGELDGGSGTAADSYDRLVVLFNDGGVLGAGGRSELATDGSAPRAVAALSLDADPALELAVITELGLHRVEIEKNATLSLGEAEYLDLPGAFAAAAADFDGDGVTDLAIADGIDVKTLFQEPRGR